MTWADMSKREQATVADLAGRFPEGWPEREAKRERRQAEMRDFVIFHGLACFSCGSGFNEWAKTGTTRGRSWAICVMCVRRPR